MPRLAMVRCLRSPRPHTGLPCILLATVWLTAPWMFFTLFFYTQNHHQLVTVPERPAENAVQHARNAMSKDANHEPEERESSSLVKKTGSSVTNHGRNVAGKLTLNPNDSRTPITSEKPHLGKLLTLIDTRNDISGGSTIEPATTSRRFDSRPAAYGGQKPFGFGSSTPRPSYPPGGQLSPQGDADHSIGDSLEGHTSPCVRPGQIPWNPPGMRRRPADDYPGCSLMEQNWVFVQGGQIWISESAKAELGKFVCNVTFFLGKEGGSQRIAVEKVGFSEGMSMRTDFCEIDCDAGLKTNYLQLHSGVAYNPSVHVSAKEAFKLKPKTGSPDLNVLILVLQSMSKSDFRNLLPASEEYLVNDLGGVTLEGYREDETQHTFLSLLSGLPEAIQQNNNERKARMKPLRGIWEELANVGYITQLASDAPINVTRHQTMTEFDNPFIHHDLRPFYRLADGYNDEPDCLGSLPYNENMLNYVRDLFHQYQDTPKFSLLHLSDKHLSHPGAHPTMDKDLEAFLKHMREDGHLNNTLLVVLSHQRPTAIGSADTFQTFWSHVPYLTLRLPEHYYFKVQYPTSFNNLLTNIQRLSTPLDLLATLRRVTHLHNRNTDGSIQRRQNLFDKIEANRTCPAAGIASAFCSCFGTVAQNSDNTLIQTLAQRVVAKINKMSSTSRRLCSELTLSSVFYSVKLVPSATMTLYKEHLDSSSVKIHGKDAASIASSMAHHDTEKVDYFQLRLKTAPNNGIYEAMVAYHHVFTEATIGDILRTDIYLNQIKCLKASHSAIVPYCHCIKPSLPQDRKDSMANRTNTPVGQLATTGIIHRSTEKEGINSFFRKANVNAVTPSGQPFGGQSLPSWNRDTVAHPRNENSQIENIAPTDPLKKEPTTVIPTTEFTWPNGDNLKILLGLLGEAIGKVESFEEMKLRKSKLSNVTVNS